MTDIDFTQECKTVALKNAKFERLRRYLGAIVKKKITLLLTMQQNILLKMKSTSLSKKREKDFWNLEKFEEAGEN